jgi:probable dihydroxyacetone kinase regulator
MSEGIITKKALAESLKKLSQKKSFDKISVADITGMCGLNRQTFYYHFQDKYELVNWIYYNEIVEVVAKNKIIDNWNDNIYTILKIMKKDGCFYQSALNTAGQNSFEEYLFEISKEMFLSVINILTAEEQLDIEHKNFVASFCSYGMVGIIKSWAKSGMKEAPEEITRYLENLVKEIEKLAVKYYLQKNDEQKSKA